MGLKQIDYNSEAYKQMVSLRYTILREPLGLTFTSDELALECNDILIASYDDDEMLGCCILSPVNADTVRLRQMAVQGSLQGKGIGAAILGFAEKIASDKGFKHIYMHARDTAIGFYERAGYHMEGSAFTEIGIPHHIMKKSL